jgi:hypothetical protein
MIKNMFREIKHEEDVTDIVAKLFAFMAIPAAMFVVAVALWTIFAAPVNSCVSGIC